MLFGPVPVPRQAAGRLGPSCFAPVLWLLFAFAAQRGSLLPAATVTQIAAGAGYSLFIESDGSLWGMGDNSSGELGLGNALQFVNVPQLIVASNVTAIAAGQSHSLFAMLGGSLWAMGLNDYGQLGDGIYNNQFFPEQIVGSQISAIGCGEYHSLFAEFRFTSRGTLWAMGLNDYAQLGDGGTSSTNTPQNILTAPALLSPAATAMLGGRAHTLLIRPGGALWAMGANEFGQLGAGALISQTNRPMLIVSSNVTAIAAGNAHSLFLESDGSLWATGANNYGQLGDGSTSTQFSPELVAFAVTAVSAGSFHSLFVKSDGSLWGMGWNQDGQLGIGSTNDQHLPVMIVPTNVVSVAAGFNHSLFIKSDGTLWAMGENGAGDLGDGTYTNRLSPVQVVPPALPRPGITNISLAGLNVTLSGTNGQSGRTYYTLMSTNIILPLNQWTLVGINRLGNDGNFTFTATNAVSVNALQQFFILQLQN
jgi:alpha-tubulin suppressor-like RCC1 family protein